MSDIRRIRSLTGNREDGSGGRGHSGSGGSGGYHSPQSSYPSWGMGSTSMGAGSGMLGGQIIAPPISFNDIHQIPIISV